MSPVLRGPVGQDVHPAAEPGWPLARGLRAFAMFQAQDKLQGASGLLEAGPSLFVCWQHPCLELRRCWREA